MKHKTTKRLMSVILAVALMAGMMPAFTFTVFAGHRCPNCEEWIDGSPYCEYCNECDQCCELCIECGICSDCSGYEICPGCSDDEGGNICEGCAEDKGYHCPGCFGCYRITEQWCEKCGLCCDCVEICDSCSAHLGEGIICVECAIDEGAHCPECGGCYFQVGGWCEECKLCFDCVEHCEYCSEEAGMTICVDCAIDAGMHCPECGGCYGDCGGEYCEECGICADCMDICSSHNLCMDCAVANGNHCPSCLACDDDANICEECGEACSDCADAFCDNCNLCGNCVDVCPDCGCCSNCAEICPNCFEHCSECAGICDDCGFCLECCQDIAGMAGCDCSDWVCVESPDWNEHFAEFHTSTGGHDARPAVSWSWNENYHWHACVYCDDSVHYTGRAAHTYNSGDICTVCGYTKNAKIHILEQPKDSKSALVTSPDEDFDERNLAHFSVKAVGETPLTYKWCRLSNAGGKPTYVELKDPEDIEDYYGPEVDILAYTDSCTNETYICCFISDKNGNQVKTVDVKLQAIHNYQYYVHYISHKQPYEFAQRNRYGHVLQCVGEECEHTTNLRPHVDDNVDGICDICDFEIGSIFVTKQPKDVKNVYAHSPDEDYDESNIAHFSVEAKGEGKLTYEWKRRIGAGSNMRYVSIGSPGRLEIYDGPDLYILAPEDSCCTNYIYTCFISDEDGNETKTLDVVLKAKHNYQYYKYYRSHEHPYEYAKRKYAGHILVCAGCGNLSKLHRHVDEDNDYCCDVCDYVKEIGEVDITVTAPKEGQKPNYNVNCASTAYSAMGGSTNYTTYRRWYYADSKTGSWKIMDKDSTFVAGKYYKFSVDVQSKSNRVFGNYNNIEPTIWAKVNGNYVKPLVMNGKTPDHNLTVEYDFGECNDSVVENIGVYGITQPVAGEKPSYTYYTYGSGYKVNEANTRYQDDNMPWPVLETERKYYIKNGIGWIDLTSGNWVYSNETFIYGHEYQVNIYLVTDEGFEFAHSKWYEPTVSATVNNLPASAITTGSECMRNQLVQYTFNCNQKVISHIDLKMATPRAGKTPADYKDISLEPEYYVADPNYGYGGIWWYDSQGNMLDKNDQFVEGERYKAEIKIIPTKVGNNNASRFSSPVTANIGSNEVLNQGDDSVMANTTTAYVIYTFKKALGPTHVPGDINNDGKVNNKDLTRLFQYLSDWDVEVNEAALDVNGDGAKNNKDLTRLFQYLSDWDVKIF